MRLQEGGIPLNLVLLEIDQETVRLPSAGGIGMDGNMMIIAVQGQGRGRDRMNDIRLGRDQETDKMIGIDLVRTTDTNPAIDQDLEKEDHLTETIGSIGVTTTANRLLVYLPSHLNGIRISLKSPLLSA
jgi:hypothetical protein